jgi:hypothetical protein
MKAWIFDSAESFDHAELKSITGNGPGVTFVLTGWMSTHGQFVEEDSREQ